MEAVAGDVLLELSRVSQAAAAVFPVAVQARKVELAHGLPDLHLEVRQVSILIVEELQGALLQEHPPVHFDLIDLVFIEGLFEAAQETLPIRKLASPLPAASLCTCFGLASLGLWAGFGLGFRLGRSTGLGLGLSLGLGGARLSRLAFGAASLGFGLWLGGFLGLCIFSSGPLGRPSWLHRLLHSADVVVIRIRRGRGFGHR